MGITFAERETRTIGIGALIVAIGAGITSNLLFLGAFQFRLDWIVEPSHLVGGGSTSAEFLRWASVLDLFGYYLATGVLAYVLWRQLRERSPVVADLTTLAAGASRPPDLIPPEAPPTRNQFNCALRHHLTANTNTIAAIVRPPFTRTRRIDRTRRGGRAWVVEPARRSSGSPTAISPS